MLADDFDQGSATGTFLKLDPSAKSAALGSALLGRASAESVYFNPAGLGYLRRTEGFLTQNEIFANITYRHASVSYPTNYIDGGVGFSLTNLDYGQQRRTRIQNEDPLTGLGHFGAEDLAFMTSFGSKLFPSLALGGTLKYVSSDIAGYQDGTLSADVGLHYVTPIPRLNIGLAVRNLFGEIQLHERPDPLPKVGEFGGNYRIPIYPGYHEIDFGFGGGISIDGDEYFFGGFEYNIYRIVALRFGYRGEQEAGEGLTFGTGMNYGGFGVNYAYVPFGELGKQQRFSISYAFGSSRPDEREKPETTEDKEPSAEVNLSQRLDRAQKLYREGSLREAYGILLQLHERVPENPTVLLWLGRVEYQLGDVESARARMKAVLEIDPDNSYAQQNLKKLTDEPDTPERNIELEQAVGLYRNEKYKEAKKLLDVLKDQARNKVKVLYWLGKTEYQLGDDQQARDRMLKILEIDPDNQRARRAFLRMN